MTNESRSHKIFNKLKNEPRITDPEFINEELTVIGASYGSYNIRVVVGDNLFFEIEYGDSFYARCENFTQFVRILDLLENENLKEKRVLREIKDLKAYLKKQAYIQFKNHREAYVTNLNGERIAKLYFHGDGVKIYSGYRGSEFYKNAHMAKTAIYTISRHFNHNPFEDKAAEDFIKKAYGSTLTHLYGRVYDLHGIDGIMRAKVRFEEGKAFVGINEFTSLANFVQAVHKTTFELN